MFWGGVLSAFNEVLTVIEQIEKEVSDDHLL
jgi:hypothetical protein